MKVIKPNTFCAPARLFAAAAATFRKTLWSNPSHAAQQRGCDHSNPPRAGFSLTARPLETGNLPCWPHVCFLAFALLNSFQPPAQAQVILAESHFDSSTNGTEGWQGIDTGDTHETLVWVSDATSGGGYISMRETKGDSQVMYFWAPPAFLGSQHAAYGGHLTFRIRQLNTDQLGSHANVILQSGSLSLIYGSVIPGTTWMSFDVPLTENTGWSVLSTGQEATQAQLLTVLSEVQSMRICGEWSTRQQEQTDLDDVVLYAGSRPFITQQPVALSVIQEQPAPFNVIAEGDPPLNYQWRFNGTNITGASTNSYTLPAAFTTNAGSYDVVVTNIWGSVTSDVATLTVLVGSNCVAPPAGLVAWWPGDGSANDIQGTNNGTRLNGTNYAPGEVGQAFSFNGSSSCVRIPFSPGLASAVFSLEAWVRQDVAIPNGQQVWVCGQDGHVQLNLLPGSSGLRPHFDFFTSAGHFSGVTSPADIPIGSMIHVAGTWDGTAERLYVNGVLQATLTPGVIAQATACAFSIGGVIETNGPCIYSGQFLNGLVDEASFYNRALSATEVAAIYAAGSAGKCKLNVGPPTIAQPPQSLTVTQGQPATLCVVASGGSPLAYQWRFNGASLTGASTNSYTLPAAFTTNTGSYDVVVTNTWGSVTSALATLTVLTGSNPPVPPYLTMAVRLANGSFQFAFTNSGGAFFTVFASTSPALPFSNWTPLGIATEISPGQFQFTDLRATNTPQRYYRVVQTGAPTNMVFIPPGTFMMGSPSNEVDRFDNEGPQTAVTISRGFWIGKYQVTQGEYQAVMGSNPSHFTANTNQPVERVSWFNTTNYCAALTQRERAAGRIPTNSVYRLPTEAEWEYACRGGTSTRFSYGDDPGYTSLANYAWYSANSGSSRTHPVGQKLPNPWGLYDIYGNVWEWCQDWAGTYPGGVAVDPQGPVTGSARVFRGGGWGDPGRYCRSSARYTGAPTGANDNVGFRVVLATGQP